MKSTRLLTITCILVVLSAAGCAQQTPRDEVDETAVREMLASVSDDFHKGDVDAFLSNFSGSEQELQVLRAAVEFLMAAADFRRQAIEAYGEEAWSARGGFSGWTEIFRSVDFVAWDSENTPIFFSPNAALIRPPGHDGFLVRKVGQEWRIDAEDWYTRELRDNATIERNGNKRPMTHEETIKYMGQFAEIFKQSAAEDIGSEGGDLDTALSALQGRFVSLVFEELLPGGFRGALEDAVDDAEDPSDVPLPMDADDDDPFGRSESVP